LIAGPNSFQKPAYFSFWFSARSSSIDSTRLVEPSRMAFTSRLSCSSSRDTLSGRSELSITPFTKRRYEGISDCASSMMNTRFT